MSKASITKQELIDCIDAWNTQKITTDVFQGWMLDHYEPMEVDIGLGEAECTREAMNIVMNEYELADEETLVQAQAALAIAFINCTEATFNVTKKRFIQDAFVD